MQLMPYSSNPVLFQQNRLTVTADYITVGSAKVFYSSVSTTHIYTGKPLLSMAYFGLAGLVLFGVFLLFGARAFGDFFSTKWVLPMMLPELVMVACGFWFKVNCLSIGIHGQSVPVLNSKNLADLEHAQRVILDAKRAHEYR
jgi:hypothetical protein